MVICTNLYNLVEREKLIFLKPEEYSCINVVHIFLLINTVHIIVRIYKQIKCLHI